VHVVKNFMIISHKKGQIAIIVVVLVILIAVGAFFFFFRGDSSSSTTGNIVGSGNSPNQDNSQYNPPSSGSPSTGNVKTFVITGDHFRFFMNGVENSDIKVKQGDKVRIEFSNTEGFHDWKIDEFNAATEQVGVGKATFVEFVADKKGTFEYYCSVGSHRANGMKGDFIVE